MKANSLHYDEIDSVEGFEKLARATGGQIHHNSISFTNTIYNGKVVRFRLEEGLSLKAWHINPFSMTFEFDKEPYNITNEKIFTLFILLTPNQISLKNSSSNNKTIIHSPVRIPFLSNNICFAVEAFTGQSFKAIDITITSSWLKKQFANESQRLINFIDRITSGNDPVIFLGKYAPDMQKSLNDFHQHAEDDDKGMVYYRAKTLQIIFDFFEYSVSNEKNILNDTHDPYFVQMLQAETLVTEHLTNNLPALNLIAKKIALSDSTLRRHFKLVFGKNIYEYYLEKKMELAKRMLLHESYNVNEIAAKLGYENVSNFISSFKKIHGISPGNIRKAHP